MGAALAVDDGAPGASRRRTLADPRLAVVAFALVESIAFPILLHLGRTRWFTGDDWFFLVSSRSRRVRILLTPNLYGHWLTLPLLAYRFLWWRFGLSYEPYLLTVIGLHLVAAALLRAVMRRCGAGPWISTAAATIFVFLGSGAEGIFSPVQITFDGALVFGLAHLLLADHEGNVDYRDALGLLCGLAGLMCSNVAIAMVVTVGIAVWWRRSWRVALLHTVPLAAIYLAWWNTYARSAHSLLAKRATLGELVPFTWKGWRQTFDGLEHSSSLGLLLFVVFVVGLVVAFTRAADRRRSAAAVALAVGAVIFIASVGLIRASPNITSRTEARYISRYVNVSAAMILPALAVAVSALSRRWRIVSPILLVVLLLGLPANYDGLARYNAVSQRATERRFLVLAHSPLLRQLDPWLRVSPGATGYMRVGWMIAGVRSGRIPTPPHVSEREAATAALTLQLSRYGVGRRHGRCRPVLTDTVVLQTGDRLIAKHGSFRFVAVTESGATSGPLGIKSPRHYRVVAGPLTLRVFLERPQHRHVLAECAPPPPRAGWTTSSTGGTAAPERRLVRQPRVRR